MTVKRNGQPRRSLSWSTAILVLIVALEVGALGVLAFHLTRGNDELGRTVSSRIHGPPTRLPAGTAFVRSRVVAPDTIMVTHWIHAGRDVRALRMQVPKVPGLGPRAISVSDLVVISDGRSIPQAAPPQGRVAATYVLPPGRHVYVSYLLTGAIRSHGSGNARAVARITALRVSTPPVLLRDITHSVVGARDLALACAPRLPTAVPRTCGGPAGGGWRVELRGVRKGDRVLARMKLP
jgi:hypothetical protein